MYNINIVEITERMIHQKNQPTIPLAPIYRIMKHETSKTVAQGAPEELHKIFYEIAAEVLAVATNLADLMDRDVITAEVLRVAYTTLRAQGRK